MIFMKDSDNFNDSTYDPVDFTPVCLRIFILIIFGYYAKVKNIAKVILFLFTESDLVYQAAVGFKIVCFPREDLRAFYIVNSGGWLVISSLIKVSLPYDGLLQVIQTEAWEFPVLLKQT